MKPEFLSYAADGEISFANERAFILQRNAFLNLRSSLRNQLGSDLAESVFFEFGFKNGKDDFQRIQKQHRSAKKIDLLHLGPKLHTGMGVTQVKPEYLHIDPKKNEFHFKGKWLNSIEAETHIAHYGISDRPVCFALCGYGTAWCSESFGSPVLEIETQCMAQGHPHCTWEIRNVANWGPEAVAWQKASQFGKKSLYNDLIQSRERLTQINRELENTVEERTLKLQTLMRVLCHDLKEPLYKLKHGAHDSESKVLIEELFSLIHSIQDKNQYESLSQAMKLEEVSIEALSQLLKQGLMEKLKKNKLSLRFINEVKPGTRLLTDLNILRQNIFENILKNALHYSPFGGELKISLTTDKRDLVISVQDQGMGMPRQTLLQLQKSLQSFEDQSLFTEKKYQGIGLKLCSNLLHSMNGHLDIDSKHIATSPEDHGTRCSIRLPLI